jgi:linoleate 10R-lipoxygenase
VIISFSKVLHAVFPNNDSLNQYVAWYGSTVTKLLQERSWKWVDFVSRRYSLTSSPHRYPGVSGTYVDIVKDVIDIAAIHVAVDKFVS